MRRKSREIHKLNRERELLEQQIHSPACKYYRSYPTDSGRRAYSVPPTMCGTCMGFTTCKWSRKDEKMEPGEFIKELWEDEGGLNES